MTDMRTETSVDLGPWKITGTWEKVDGGLPSRGPVRLVIELSPDASSKERRRGVNTTLLRKVEGVLPALRAALKEQGRGWGLRSIGNTTAEVMQLLAEMPESPRSDPENYYPRLITAYGLLEEETLNPTADLHKLMELSGIQISRTGLAKQLHRARELREEGGN